MSFGNILNQMLQDGLGGRGQTRDRLDASSRSLGAAPGIDRVFGELQRALGGGAGVGQVGFAERARDFLGSEQAKGLTGGQIGGIGAAAGAVLGGGVGGAVRGGALALLGTLAYTALRRAQAGDQAGSGADAPPAPSPEEVRALTGPDTERLVLRAMIGAAKADGHVTKDELDRILGHLDGEAATEEERRFVFEELANPSSPADIAASVSGQAQAAEVYAAALMAVGDGSPAERRYLADLAAALGVDRAAVDHLHEMTGAPPA